MITLTVLANMPLERLRTQPRQIVVASDDVMILSQQGNNAIVSIKNRLRKHYLVAESAEQIVYLKNNTGYPSVAKESLSAAGTTQGGATQINKYIAEVTSASAGSEGVKLPKATDARIEEVYLIVNKSGYPIKVYPASGDFINEQEVDTSLTLTLGEMATFYIKYWSGSEPE